MLRMLQMAAGVALPTNTEDQRNFWLGAVGIRNDGAIVTSRNGAAEFHRSVKDYQLMPNSHAEGRCLRKLGKRGIMYVARVSRQDQSLKMARPCPMCQVRIRSAQIEKVYYTINDHEYGLWIPATDKHSIFKD